MSVGVASLVALLIAITLSCTSKINVGLLAIAFAWVIGVYLGHLSTEEIAKGFPGSLFLTLAGVTLLFAIADTNGTLEQLAHRAVRLARGEARALPILFFTIASLISSVGPGAISSVALVAPLAMAIGYRAGVSRFLIALMVANGANAGNLSPVSSVGVIVNTKMAAAGVYGHEWKVWFANFSAHVLVAIAGYLFFGGLRPGKPLAGSDALTGEQALSRKQWSTIGVTLVWILGVVVFKLHVGLSAFAAVSLLVFAGSAEESAVFKRVPWSIIVMVSGMSVLIALLERTGGMDLFAEMLARLSGPTTVNGMIAFVTGVISSYSSTSGVVLPAFLPAVPSLIQKVGGGDPLAVSLSINIGSALVDVSPLSTLGALCVATVTDGAAAKVLFRQLLVWGLSMAVVGAVLCQLFAGVLAGL